MAFAFAGASGVFAFILYCSTLALGVGVDDSGELMAAACEPGIVHPPGYPLLTILGHAMVRIPWGDVGIRLNLLSAIFGACSTWLVARAVALITRSPSAVIITAIAWSFAPAVWSWSTLMEVFALNNCLIAAMLNINIAMQTRPSTRLIAAWMLLAGLALGNQLTVLFWLPFGGLWLLFANLYLVRQARVIAIAALALLIGLLPYLYLPIAAWWQPEVRWGDVTTISGLVRHVSRAEFGALQMAQTQLAAGQSFFANLWLYLRAQTLSIGIVGWLLLAAYLWRDVCKQGRRRFNAVAFLFAAWVFYALVFHFLANIDVKNALYERMLSRFWLQPHLYLSVLLGCSWMWLEQISKPRWHWPRRMLGIGLVAVMIFSGQKTRIVDASDYYSGVGQAILKAIPADALIITQGDFHYNILAYLKHCKKYRQDLHIIRQEILPAQWSRNYLSDRIIPLVNPEPRLDQNARALTLNEILEFNLAKRAVYLADDRWFLQSNREFFFELIPVPLLYQVSLRSRDIPLATRLPQVEQDFQNLIATITQAQPHLEKDLWTEKITDTIWVSRANFGQYMLELGRDRTRSNEDQKLALQVAGIALEQVAQNWPQIAGGFWKNLGLYYFLTHRANPAHRQKAIAAWQHYLRQDREQDADTAELRRLIEALNNHPAN